MANVDPFTIDLSGEWYKNPETVHFMNRWFHDMFIRTGGGTDIIEENQQRGAPIAFSSQLQQQRRELDGLPEFTMDATGFTMDSTEFTMDKVIA